MRRSACLALIAVASCSASDRSNEATSRARSPLAMVATPLMSLGRNWPSAVTLADGRVIAIGGRGGGFDVAQRKTAEVFDLATSTWSTPIALASDRIRSSTARLPDGRVLMVGAYDPAGGIGGGSSAAEIFDPATSKSTAVASAPRTTWGASLHVGKDGRAWVVDCNVLVFNPATSTWATSAAAPSPACAAPSAMLNDGRVLVAGGLGSKGPTSAAAILELTTGTWTSVAPLAVARAHHTITTIPDGRVLVIGGQNGTNATPPPDGDGAQALASAEIFDPATGAWTAGPSLVGQRTEHTAIVLPSGRVLVAGGSRSSWPTRSGRDDAEIVDVKRMKTVAAPKLAGIQDSPASAALGADAVIVVGGSRGSIFREAKDGEPCATPGECTSSSCVDGVCCNTDCVYSCKTGVCGSTCASNDDCARGHRCAAGACVAQAEPGAACTTNGDCKSGACIEGVCCTSSAGCGKYKCVASGCRDSCTSSDQCVSGFACASDGRCVAEATCSADRAASITVDGRIIACNGFLCGAGGKCATTCTASSDCATGYLCDTASGKCTAPPPQEDDGGCTHGRRTRSDVGWLAVLLIALARISRGRC